MIDLIDQLTTQQATFAIVRLPENPEPAWFAEKGAGATLQAIGFLGERWPELRACTPDEISGSNNRTSSIAPYCCTKEEYTSAFHSLHELLSNSTLDKAVLSRIKQSPISIESLGHLFQELTLTYPKAFVYLLSQNGQIWMGASPELLIARQGDNVSSAAIAGTISSSLSESAWTKKERMEQQYVTDYIAQVFGDHGAVNQMEGPSTIQAGPVKHLKTVIRGTTTDFETLLSELHPTPAVCGIPKNEALTTIKTNEPHERGLYTGFIKITDHEATQCYVNLRCLQIHQGKAYLYLGGGLTADSELEKEWQETEHKARTLLDVIEKL